MPMLYTITRVPEELTLHETPMWQSYGIDYVSGDAWEEMDACLTALAMRAAEQGRRLTFVLTTARFSVTHSEHKFWSRLSSFAKVGTLKVSRRPPNYNYAKGPF